MLLSRNQYRPLHFYTYIPLTLARMGSRTSQIFLRDTHIFQNDLAMRNNADVIIIIIISHLMSHCWGTGLPYGLITIRTGHNPPHGPSADWLVLTTANTAGTNGLTSLPKHGGARDITFLVIHPMTDLTFCDRT
jgi:hypothetical protein